MESSRSTGVSLYGKSVVDPMSALAEEACHFHACLFDCPPDEIAVARYEAAHGQLFAGQPSPPWIARIVERHLDAEAIEFALRRRGRGRELTRKLQIVCYLAEARSPHLAQFVNLEASRRRAWTALTRASLGALAKFCKGEYCIRRHGLL